MPTKNTNRPQRRRNRKVLIAAAQGIPVGLIAQRHKMGRNRTYQVIREEFMRQFPGRVDPPTIQEVRSYGPEILRNLNASRRPSVYYRLKLAKGWGKYR